MATTVSLVKVFQASTSYATDHEANYTAIESAINSLSLLIGGATSVLDVPIGLREIFDRNGIIGKASYKPSDNGGVALPSNNLTVAAGAYWSTSYFAKKDTTTLINMDAFSTATLYINVPNGGVPSVATSASADTAWQFAYNQATDIVSAVALYSTCDILLDGDDYKGMLGSYQSVAERLTAMEAGAGILGTYYAEDAAAHSGLNFGYKAGKVQNDNVVTATGASTTLLAASNTNYIEVHPGTGVVTDNVVGFTVGRIPLFTVTTTGGAINVVTDQRSWARAGGSGGGHAQNTDLGTDAAEFKLNRLVTGAPSLNASFKAERGSSADVDIRWNESTDKWEFTNDGSVYTDIGAAAAFDPGAQQLTKYVAKLDPPTIIERLAISTDGAYINTNLSPSGDNVITDAPQGCQALVLRVQFWDSDSTPDSTVNVKFKQYNGASSPLKSYTVWADGVNEQDKVQTIIVGPGDDGGATPIVGFSYLVTASGANTANVRVFLCGYMVKVTGVGSQTKSFSSTGNTVAAATTTNFNKTGFINRGLVYNLTITETGGTMTGTYDIEIYKKDTFVAGDLLYSAQNIDATASSRVYTDRLPFMYLDGDSTSELHIKIRNDDGAQSGTWTIAITAEQFL